MNYVTIVQICITISLAIFVNKLNVSVFTDPDTKGFMRTRVSGKKIHSGMNLWKGVNRPYGVSQGYQIMLKSLQRVSQQKYRNLEQLPLYMLTPTYLPTLQTAQYFPKNAVLIDC